MAILLTNYQCLGDILMLTACVRDLKKKAHSNMQVIVYTSAMRLFKKKSTNKCTCKCHENHE